MSDAPEIIMTIPPMTWPNAAENCAITGPSSVRPLIIDRYPPMTRITTIDTITIHIILNLNQRELENHNNKLIDAIFLELSQTAHALKMDMSKTQNNQKQMFGTKKSKRDRKKLRHVLFKFLKS